MPSLGADMDAGTLVEWRIKPGDTVKRGDVVEFKVWSPTLGQNGGTRAVSVVVQK